MTVRFHKPTPEEIEASFYNPRCSAPYTGNDRYNPNPRGKITYMPTLRINNLPENVRVFGFPCGENECMTLATKVLVIQTLDAQYEMPLCANHADRLAKDAHIDSL